MKNVKDELGKSEEVKDELDQLDHLKDELAEFLSWRMSWVSWVN